MKVIITGPPCAGKSSIIEPLSKVYETIPEVSRHWIAWFKKHEPYHLPWNNREYFQSFVETQQLYNYFIELESEVDFPVFFDRGLPDEIGYRKFFNIPIPQTLIDNCNKYRYDKVLYFSYWHDIYKKDEIRIETHEEAQKIDFCLRKAYTDVGYDLIEIPFGTIEERLAFIKEKLDLKHHDHATL